MLSLKDIVKNYETGNEKVEALKGVTLNFRESEFVSVLGPSGCGKTTLLNLIGGLDRYTSGDMLINGVSTKTYKDRDWDSYRNHKIGFVFQSYNLIPHQSVLANVELALTLSGVSKKERRSRAKQALEKVGLSDCINKKPNQMSGGQMQRVAIARALVNDPEILLADEPTGALDSVTSEQVMALLKEIASDRLVIMVTHNPDIAERYSTRIIKFKDGVVTSDSNPFEQEEAKKEAKKTQKTSMKFATAFSLSLNNLLTKKGRTVLTSFAGSIGIIGIALILSLSSGIQTFIDSLQRDTLSSYPITIEAESRDLSSMMTMFSGGEESQKQDDLTKIYSQDITYKMMNSITNTKVNNMAKFKKFVESDEEINRHASAIQFGYGQELLIYKDSAEVEQLNPSTLFEKMGGASFSDVASSFANLKVWQEALPDETGGGINSLIKDQYVLVDGKWPEKYNEVLLVVDQNNSINDTYTFCLGLKDSSEVDQIMEAIANGEEIAPSNTAWDIDEIIGTTYKLVLPTDKYQYDPVSERYVDKSENQAFMEIVVDNAEEVEICGIIKPNPNSSTASLQCALLYTKELTDHYLSEISKAEIIEQQLKDKKTDVVSGLKFDDGSFDKLSDEQKAEEIKNYYKDANIYVKTEAYKSILSTPTDEYLDDAVESYMEAYPNREAQESAIIEMYSQQAGMSEDTVRGYLEDMTDQELDENMRSAIREMAGEQYTSSMEERFAGMSMEEASYSLDIFFEDLDVADTLSFAEEQYISDNISPSTYEENLKAFGFVEEDNPTSINIYAKSFEEKDMIADRISYYNTTVKTEEDEINYTDYVGIMMSSVTTMINAVSYGLIAFVAISLVVSSIMIGIITYISVLERTKEIGILRSIGASKKDISRVFNAETAIVGLTSGLMGILITVLLCIPINKILHALTDLTGLNASLPPVAGLILVLISVSLTLIAGLIPSRLAAKKDPVVALRTE